MQQPPIHDNILRRLHRVAAAYEFETDRFLNHLLLVALDELEGREDDCTVCIPVKRVRQLAHREDATDDAPLPHVR